MTYILEACIAMHCIEYNLIRNLKMGRSGNFTLPKIFEVVLKSLAYNVTHTYLKGSKHYKFTVNLVSIALDERDKEKKVRLIIFLSVYKRGRWIIDELFVN